MCGWLSFSYMPSNVIVSSTQVMLAPPPHFLFTMNDLLLSFRTKSLTGNNIIIFSVKSEHEKGEKTIYFLRILLPLWLPLHVFSLFGRKPNFQDSIQSTISQGSSLEDDAEVSLHHLLSYVFCSSLLVSLHVSLIPFAASNEYER
jgi:hypothetical protein